jgi:hypothetical protein
MIVTDRRGRPFKHPETPDEPPGRQELFFRGEDTSVNGRIQCENWMQPKLARSHNPSALSRVFRLVRWDQNDKLMPVSRAEAAMFTKELSGPQP